MGSLGCLRCLLLLIPFENLFVDKDEHDLVVMLAWRLNVDQRDAPILILSLFNQRVVRTGNKK